MTPITPKPDVATRPDGTRRPDFAARLKARTRELRSRLERRETLVEAIRAANTSLEPQNVARWLVGQADSWVSAPCWSVVAHDMNGQLAVMAERGLLPAFGPSLWSAAHWVVLNGVEFLTGDHEADARSSDGAAGTVIGLPLRSRQRTIGALVGIDPVPSRSVPVLGAALTLSLRTVLEPPAIALDSALAIQKAEALSVTDDLTRLYNSRFLNQVLRRETKRAVRSGRPLSILFIDLDGFKLVNDTHGHLAGSKALVEVATILRGCARETDVVARYGGDEFSLVLPETGREGAIAVASRIRERLSNWRFLSSLGVSVHLTASIGIATLPDVAASTEELIRAADQAMYRVKAAGKDGVHVAQE